MDYRAVPELAKKFDAVVSFETIEHVIDPQNFLKVIASVLKETGQVICSSPNKARFSGSNIINPFHHSELTYEDFVRLFQKFFTITAQYHQTESIQFKRFMQLYQQLNRMNNRFHAGMFNRIERLFRRILRRPLMQMDSSPSDLINLMPGDMEISPLSNPTKDHKTYILVGRLR